MIVDASDHRDALVAALLELDRHLGDRWDEPARLFALVLTDVLAPAEPVLAADLRLRTTAEGGLPGALTAIEQDEFNSTGDLLGDLASLEWPEDVFGCAVSAERTFLPAQYEAEIPADPAQATRFVAEHPARQDLRVVVGADRLGHRHGVARLASRPDDLLGGEDLVPGLAEVLVRTLTPVTTGEPPDRSGSLSSGSKIGEQLGSVEKRMREMTVE